MSHETLVQAARDVVEAHKANRLPSAVTERRLSIAVAKLRRELEDDK